MSRRENLNIELLIAQQEIIIKQNDLIIHLLKNNNMTQIELAAALNNNTAILNQVASDVLALVNNTGNVIPEVETALNELNNATNNLRNAVPAQG